MKSSDSFLSSATLPFDLQTWQLKLFDGCNDAQQNDIQHNDIQLNDAQYNDIQHNDIQHNNKKCDTVHNN